MPFTEVGNIGGKSGLSSHGIGNLVSSYDHVGFEMSTKHRSKGMPLALFMNVAIKREINTEAID